MDALIYITFFIAVYVMYLTLKYKYTVCKSDISTPVLTPPEPIRVSQIFTSMFQNETPRPGNISLNINSQITPNI